VVEAVHGDAGPPEGPDHRQASIEEAEHEGAARRLAGRAVTRGQRPDAGHGPRRDRRGKVTWTGIARNEYRIVFSVDTTPPPMLSYSYPAPAPPDKQDKT
jgi:hypothetical protein